MQEESFWDKRLTKNARIESLSFIRQSQIELRKFCENLFFPTHIFLINLNFFESFFPDKIVSSIISLTLT